METTEISLGWINLIWCAATLFMVFLAALKFKAGSQPIGAVVVMVLGIGQIVAVLTGYETIAQIACIAMLGTAFLLVIGQERWKAKRRGD
ncbi:MULTISPECIES: hypothetical protein [Alcaligenes]|uniref:Uncharacterized protein n=2 Tax=Alcaligenes TaxID=507 RepID=A0A3G2HXV4_9BURK|nr:MULTISPECIES: hypothetical protein [Alcaligenes]AYN21996.1 hypothetical protein D3M96_16535 [Alcaligenes aquatilis]MCX5566503.1 hypothetical protein [Alcaligenes phenolicus]